MTFAIFSTYPDAGLCCPLRRSRPRRRTLVEALTQTTTVISSFLPLHFHEPEYMPDGQLLLALLPVSRPLLLLLLQAVIQQPQLTISYSMHP